MSYDANDFAMRFGLDALRAELDRTEPQDLADFLDVAGPDIQAAAEPRASVSANRYQWADPASIAPREWLYGRHLIRGHVSADIAPGGVGKSSLAIAEALAMVSGKPLLSVSPKRKLRVWLWNLEDPADELTRRIQATAKRYGLTSDDLDDRLFVDSGRDQPLVIAEMTRGAAAIVSPVVDALVAEIIANDIDVLIIDPFVSCHELSENDNGSMDLIAKEWGSVANRGQCAVELIHHTRKMLGIEAEVTTESSRGGKALTDACRSVRAINRMTREEGERAGVGERYRLHFRTFNDKSNLAPPPEKSDWFCLEGVELGNGDNVGVVVPWQWPDPTASITANDIFAVQRAIDGKSYRASIQSPDWVGRAVAEALGPNLDAGPDKETVKAALRMWLASGALVVDHVKDEKGNKRPIVSVGEWAQN